MIKKCTIIFLGVILAFGAIIPYKAFANETNYGFKLPENYFIIEGVAESFSEGLISVYDENAELYGYKDINGNTIIEPQFKWADKFSNGLAFVKEDVSCGGYIDSTGQYIIPPLFIYGDSFENGVAIVSGTNGMQIIDRTGNSLLEKDGYESIFVFEDNYYCLWELGSDIFDLEFKKVKSLEKRIVSIYDVDGRKVAIFEGDQYSQGAMDLETEEIIISTSEPYTSCMITNSFIVTDNYSEGTNRAIYDLSGNLIIQGFDFYVPLNNDLIYFYDMIEEKPYLLENGKRKEADFYYLFDISPEMFAARHYIENSETWTYGIKNKSCEWVIEKEFIMTQITDNNVLIGITENEILYYNNKMELLKTISLKGNAFFATDHYVIEQTENKDWYIYDESGNEIMFIENASSVYCSDDKTIYIKKDDKTYTIFDKAGLEYTKYTDLVPSKMTSLRKNENTPPLFIKADSYKKYSNGKFTLYNLYDPNEKMFIHNGRLMVSFNILDQIFPYLQKTWNGISYMTDDRNATFNADMTEAAIKWFDFENNRFITEVIQFETPGIVKNGLEYLPIRSIAEAFGLSIYWDDENKIAGLSVEPVELSEEEHSIIVDGFNNDEFNIDDIRKIDASLATQPFLELLTKKMLGIEYLSDYPSNIAEYTNTIPAYEALIAKTKDLILVTEPSEDMLNLATNKGIELEIVPFAKEGFVFLVNAENSIESLTVEQLRGIYSGKYKNWNELGGSDLAIIPYQRNQNSGSQTIMENVFMNGYSLINPLMEQRVASMEGLIDVVAEFKADVNAGIGYSVYYFAQQMYGNDNVRLLKINGIEPTTETIRNNSYPIIVNYYAVKRKDDNSALTKALLEYILSDKGQKYVDESGLVSVK